MKKLSVLLAVLLAACGNGTTTAPAGPAEPAAPAQDAFFTRVLAVVAAAPDDTEAAGIDAMATNAPDNSDPSAL